MIGTRGVIVSPASATGGSLELAIDKLYGMFEVDAEDNPGDISSMLSEYVASRVQPEAVLTEEDEEFGHMPPKT